MDKDRIGYLRFNVENKKIGILDNMDLWADDGLHSGTTLEVNIHGEWIADRIEMYKDEYYLVNSELCGYELEGLKVKY